MSNVIRQDNLLTARPEYHFHRISAGAPVAPDGIPGTLPVQAALNCRGWRSIVAHVRLTGGAAPTVTLQVLRVVDYVNQAGVEVLEYVTTDFVTGAMGHLAFAAIPVSEDRVFLRIHAVTGNPTLVEVLVAGETEKGDAIPTILDVGDVEIGAVEIKDADADLRAKVAVVTGLAETDRGLCVQAPVLGVTSGAALDADGPGSLQQYLRGLLKAFLARIPTLGPKAATASLPVTGGVRVGNAPVGGAGGFAVADNLTHGIDNGASLDAGGEYLVEVWPDVAAGGAVSDVVWGWVKSDTTVSAQGDGRRVATGYPVEVRPVAGKLRLSFMRDLNTPFPCRVYVHRLDV